MHDPARKWIADHVPDKKVRVVEFGGRYINGRVRDLFDTFEYTNVDLVDGEDVDVVGDAATYTHPIRVDVVICCETFEHTADWRLICKNAARNCGYDGQFLVTAAGPGWPTHSAVDGEGLRAGEHYENIDPLDLYDCLFELFSRVEVKTKGRAVFAVAKGVR